MKRERDVIGKVNVKSDGQNHAFENKENKTQNCLGIECFIN